MSAPGARHPVTLAFLDPDLEAAFEAETGSRRLHQLRLGLVVSIVIWSSLVLVTWLSAPPHWQRSETILVGTTLPFCSLCLLLTRWAEVPWRRVAIGAMANAIAGLLALWSIYELDLFAHYGAAVTMFAAVYSFLFLGLRFLPAAIATASYVLAYDVVRVGIGGPNFELVVDFVLNHVGTATMAVAAYRIEDAQRDAFFQRRKSDRLLLNILPEVIAARLRDDASTIADAHADATVLFADLVGFTPLSATLTPTETVQLLDELFRAFDELAARHGLEKIKTIGDAYMVAGGVPAARDDHATAVAAMGLDMLGEVRRIAAAREVTLALRVGIHTGPVVAGVIGKRKFSYDLWGDTVNTASRMESHGVAGRVQITDATRAALGDAFATEDRGTIDVKGKGAMRAWLLVGVLGLLAACGGASKPAVHEPEPPQPDAPACTGEIEPHDGLAAVEDPALLAQALAKDGEGKLCMGQVYEVTAPITVYRVWTAEKAYTQIGGWWSFDEPMGPADAYREANAICPEWSNLDRVSRCTVKLGAHLVVGPGQSATCEGDVVYPQSAVNQVFIPNDTRIDQVFVEDCTPGEAWPPP